MRKFFTTFFKTLLILIVIGAVGWYAFGVDGPFAEQGQEFMAKLKDESIEAEASEVTQDLDSNMETDKSENTAEAEPEPELTPEQLTTKIVFTGDVELSEYVQSNYSSKGVDGVCAPEVQSLLRDATFTMINNEFCFSERGQKAPDKQYTFRVNPSFASLYNDLGVDIAGLANNHVLDYGKDALTDTFAALTNVGVDYTGAGNSLEEAKKLIVKTDKKGRTYGFLAASHVIPVGSWNVVNSQPGEFCFYDETELLKTIAEARSQVDYLFVMVHWGVEHTTDLTDYQQNDAHKFIDAGADAVIGMHSHCIQPVEIYNGKPVFYSLGNFIFNQNIKAGGGGAVEVTVDENNQISYRILPVMASGACTYLDNNSFSYVESISNNVSVGSDGLISEK